MYLMKVGSAKSSAAEVYLKETKPDLWQHVQKYSVPDTASGMRMLRYNMAIFARRCWKRSTADPFERKTVRKFPLSFGKIAEQPPFTRWADGNICATCNSSEVGGRIPFETNFRPSTPPLSLFLEFSYFVLCNTRIFRFSLDFVAFRWVR